MRLDRLKFSDNMKTIKLILREKAYKIKKGDSKLQGNVEWQ